jgi:hypothetical protein
MSFLWAAYLSALRYIVYLGVGISLYKPYGGKNSLRLRQPGRDTEPKVPWPTLQR